MLQVSCICHLKYHLRTVEYTENLINKHYQTKYGICNLTLTSFYIFKTIGSHVVLDFWASISCLSHIIALLFAFIWFCSSVVKLTFSQRSSTVFTSAINRRQAFDLRKIILIHIGLTNAVEEGLFLAQSGAAIPIHRVHVITFLSFGTITAGSST